MKQKKKTPFFLENEMVAVNLIAIVIIGMIVILKKRF
jgi:hypothetical protein